MRSSTEVKLLVAQMTTRDFYVILCLAIGFGSSCVAHERPSPVVSAPSLAEYPSPLVREEQTIEVDGVVETWRLQWSEPPKPYCQPTNESGWDSCGCWGVAFGEVGRLFLVRLRGGIELERLQLADPVGMPLAPKMPNEVGLQRWPVADGDLGRQLEVLQKEFRRRETVRVMRFRDYDHDGRATEFLVEGGSFPCGHGHAYAVGISRSNPRLHVFGTASHPTEPLNLDPAIWADLAAARGSVEEVVLECGDHASEERIRLKLWWNARGIDGVFSHYDCSRDGAPSHFLSEESL